MIVKDYTLIELELTIYKNLDIDGDFATFMNPTEDIPAIAIAIAIDMVSVVRNTIGNEHATEWESASLVESDLDWYGFDIVMNDSEEDLLKDILTFISKKDTKGNESFSVKIITVWENRYYPDSFTRSDYGYFGILDFGSPLPVLN